MTESEVNIDSRLKELEAQKLEREIEELEKPWWKRVTFQTLVIPAFAAIIAIGQAWMQQKFEIEELPNKVKQDIKQSIKEGLPSNYREGASLKEYADGYAIGLLRSPDGQAALEKAIQSGSKKQFEVIIRNIVGQTFGKIIKPLEDGKSI